MTQRKLVTTFSKSLTFQLVSAVALFVVSALLARGNHMSGAEKAVFRAIYGLPSSLTPIFVAITQLGNIYVLLILAALYLLKRHYHIVLRLLMSGLLAYLLTNVAKDLVGRSRPDVLMSGVIFRDLALGPGFPSGHTALATAIALTLGPHISKKYRWLVPVVIISVAFSRIYLGVHAPLDVVGGFTLGWLSVIIYKHVRISDITGHPQPKTKKVLKKRKNDSKLRKEV